MFLFQGKGIGSKMFDFAESLAPVSEVGVISGFKFKNVNSMIY
jgi:hypothetical protein